MFNLESLKKDASLNCKKKKKSNNSKTKGKTMHKQYP